MEDLEWTEMRGYIGIDILGSSRLAAAEPNQLHEVGLTPING
jgi:hypothetical protein